MKWLSLYQLGLRGRLFAAFGAVAATTVLASGTAFVSYDRLGRSLEVVTGTSLPHVTRASNIAVSAADVVGHAQALLAASSTDELTRALKSLDAARSALNNAVAALAGDDAAKLKETAQRMSESLDRLASRSRNARRLQPSALPWLTRCAPHTISLPRNSCQWWTTWPLRSHWRSRGAPTKANLLTSDAG